MDAMDQFSKPLKTEETKLGIKFTLNPRRRAEKAGRELLVTYDERWPMVEGFECKYSYFVRFLKAGNVAGKHYHESKHEIMVPIMGKFEFKLEDIETKETDQFELDAADNQAFYVRARVSHSVQSIEEGGVMLVLASSPNSNGDEYPYEMKYRDMPDHSSHSPADCRQSIYWPDNNEKRLDQDRYQKVWFQHRT